MKVCLGVILYNPSQENINNILKYSEIIKKIYIYDNTDIIDSGLYKTFSDKSIYKYMPQKSNLGMAKALNDLCNTAILDGYDYIITMDQDSIFENSSIALLVDFISNNDLLDIGIVAPNVKFSNWKTGRFERDSILKHENEYSLVNWTITSGSAVNLKSYLLTEGFDEKYFIDRLDFDYCEQLNMLNKKIIVLNKSILYQKLGEGTRSFYGFRYSEHSTLRNYYIFRNRLYYSDKHLHGIKRIFFRLTASFKQLLMIILIDNYKLDKVKILSKAYRDYTKGKMNKYSSEL